MNLESSTQKVWKVVTQIIHFQMWNKRTFEWIITSSIKDWTFTKMMTTDWRMIMVNWHNVDCIEVFNNET